MAGNTRTLCILQRFHSSVVSCRRLYRLSLRNPLSCHDSSNEYRRTRPCKAVGVRSEDQRWRAVQALHRSQRRTRTRSASCSVLSGTAIPNGWQYPCAWVGTHAVPRLGSAQLAWGSVVSKAGEKRESSGHAARKIAESYSTLRCNDGAHDSRCMVFHWSELGRGEQAVLCCV